MTESARSLLCLTMGLVLLVSDGCVGNNRSGPAISSSRASDPVHTTYRLDGAEVHLREGRFATPAAPGSATMATATVIDVPTRGDLDGDGDIDAAVVIAYQTGGSGTFYYLVAAINGVDGYQGTNGMLLGDRIVPLTISINNRIIAADIRDRAPGRPKAMPPTIDLTRYAYLEGDSLVAVPAEGEESGWFTFGHEVRSFQPCGAETEYWLLGRSPAIADILNIYRSTMANARPYTPMFVVLTGSKVAPPGDGFGADYRGAFFATGLVDATAAGHCRMESIVVEAPAPGAVISSPLLIRGRARGSWFFEGDFPVVLEDSRGQILATGYVTAQGEWMTKDFVSFTGTLSFIRPDPGDTGSLVFIKDNPSDRPELDDAMSIPVLLRE